MAAPAVVVHGLAAARAAAGLADPTRGLVLLSAPGAGLFAGAAWFAALAAAAGRPGLPMLALLDCGPAAGAVLAAFRAGIPAAVFTGGDAIAASLEGIAAEYGAILLRRAPPALDLAGFRPGSPSLQHRLAAWVGPAG